ncbi:MAG: DUF86 domain-containing protein [Bacillaceae bacterium]|nr:DUF86 domain-containing protein [Bacillaceae bacterium]
MRRRNKLYLKDILQSMEKIDTYTRGLDYDTFMADEMRKDAVIRNLEIIGEAAKHVSHDIKKRYPDVPWNRMVGLRNDLIHEYYELDPHILWQVITVNIPDTKPWIEQILSDFKNEPKKRI